MKDRHEHDFLHVGYPKTGTTTLQSNLFEKHSQVFDFRSQVDEMSKIREKVCRKTSFRPESFKLSLCDAIQRSTTDIGVYSEEVITSNLENTAPVGIDRPTVAKRLSGIFTNKDTSVEVLIFIRNQQSFLLSAFAFWYYNYQSMGFDSLDDLIQAGTEGNDRAASNILSWLRYFDTIFAYRKHFGHQKVHVMLYEKFSQNTKRFARNLSQVMRINADESEYLLDSSTDRNVTKNEGERKSPSKLYHWLATLKSTHLPEIGSIRSFTLGQWFVRWLRGRGQKISLSENSVSRLRSYYGDDNQRIEAEFGIPIGEHGYFVS